jgi:hypothetical protein
MDNINDRKIQDILKQLCNILKVNNIMFISVKINTVTEYSLIQKIKALLIDGLNYLGVQNYDSANIRNLWSIFLKKINNKKESEVEIKQKIIDFEISKNSIFMDIEDVINYSSSLSSLNRFICIIPIPIENLAQNTNGYFSWKSHGSPQPSVLYNTCTNCAFFNSTGTSNEINFPGVWFPVLRITQDGWIAKAQFLCKSKIFMKNLEKFGINVSENSFINIFLEKFSHWWQVSISSALPSTTQTCLWSTHPDLIKLKAIALNYVYNPDESIFYHSDAIIKKYNINTDNCPKISNKDVVNDWFYSKNALCQIFH